MPSHEYEMLLAAMRAAPLIVPGEPLEIAREKLEAVHGHPVADDTAVEWIELDGIRCAWVATRPHVGSSRVLLLCHGGAFVAACGNGYLFYAEMLSRWCHARVLLVDYRLAPEHRYPAALDDCVAAYGGLLEEGTPPQQIGFIGDSCGGGLAIAALVKLREQRTPLPALAITLGGWFDLDARDGDAGRPEAADPFAHPAFVRDRGRDYVGPGGHLDDPLVSPLHADLTGLPPLFLQVGDVDLTHDDAHRLAEHAQGAGVEATVDVHADMIHGFQGLASAGIPEAIAALERVGEFVRSRIS